LLDEPIIVKLVAKKDKNAIKIIDFNVSFQGDTWLFHLRIAISQRMLPKGITVLAGY